MAFFVLVAVPVSARAWASGSGSSSVASGAAALREARSAWERGLLDTAEPLYREALEKGGLAPAEVLEGFVRLGAIRASFGKKEQAIKAFRAASILDAAFVVPAEAGPRGVKYAAQAKKDTANVGSLKLALRAPTEAPSGKAFTVVARLDSAHVPIVAMLGLVARDGTSGNEAVLEAKPGENVEFDVPSQLTIPSAVIVVHIDALDQKGNRLASAEEHVRIPATHEVTMPRADVEPVNPSATRVSAPAERAVRKGEGFWLSPWPYAVGSLALAGAVTAVVFGASPMSTAVSIPTKPK